MIYLCLGRREQGKTTLGLYLTRSTRARVLFDPRGLLPVPAGSLRVTRRVDLDHAFDDMWDRHGQVVITPDGSTQTMFEATSRQIKRWVREPGAPPIAFLVDELRFVDTNAESFDWLCRCATRAQVTIVATAHRPTDVKTDMRAIADVWCLFQTTQERDLDSIEERCGLAVRRAVVKLEPRQFIVWDDTRAQMKFYGDPSAWYTPLNDAAVTTADVPALPEGSDLPIDKGPLFR